MEISSKTSKEVLQESIDQLSYIFNRDSVECKHSIFQGTCCFGTHFLCYGSKRFK